jgi:hypothetical protein
MLFELLVLILLIVGGYMLFQTTETRPMSLAPKSASASATTISMTGTVPRGPIRVNISDETLEAKHASLGTGLNADNIRRDRSHVAFMYQDSANILLNNKPAVILGFKDKHTYGANEREYGHVITQDGTQILAFDSLSPSEHQATRYTFQGLRGLKGTGISTLYYTTRPSRDSKEVSLSGEVELA